MNANHARPLVAFWALALAAAVITVVGLRAGAQDVTVPGGSPQPARSSGTPELVLGGVLTPRAVGVLGNPFSPELWSPVGTTADTSARQVQVSPPETGTTGARSQVNEQTRPTTVPTDGAGVTKALVNASSKPHKEPPGHSKAAATATATPVPTPDGPGNGKGPGADHTGKGSGH